MTLEVTPKSASPGESVTLTASATLSDPQASKANISVAFKASPATLVRFNGTPQAKTNASGVATISATVRRDHGVRAVKSGDSKAVKGKSDSAQSALDDEVRAMASESADSSDYSGAAERDEKIEFGASATVVKSLSASTSLVLSDKTKPACKFEPVDIPETVGAEPFTVKMRFSCTKVEGSPEARLDGHEIVPTVGSDGEPQKSLTLHTDSDGYAFAVFQASGAVNPLDQAVGRADDGRLVSAANPNAVLEPVKKVAADPAIRQIVVTGGKAIIIRAALLLSLEAAGAAVIVGGAVVTATIYWKMSKDEEQYNKGTTDAQITQPPGDCKKQRFKELDDEVGRKCKSLPRSCKEEDVEPRNCPEFELRLQRNQECVSARQQLMDECFHGGDARHNRVRNDEVKAREYCRKRIKDECP
ncbi:MAG: hypothetical protein ABL955_00950 [Elusimicrobiota bacterium]